MTLLYAPADQFTINDTDGMVCDDPFLRLRARNPDDNALPCVAAFNFESIGASWDANALDAAVRCLNLVDANYCEAQNFTQYDTALKRYGSWGLKIRNSYGAWRFVPSDSTYTNFIVDFWISIANVAYVGALRYILSEYVVGVNSMQRWSLEFQNQVFTFRTYDGAGANDAVTADCTVGGPLVNGTFYHVRLYYDRAGNESRIIIRNTADVTMGSGTSNTAKTIPLFITGNEYLGISYGGLTFVNIGMYPYQALLDTTIDDLQVWHGISATAYNAAVTGAAQTIYAATSGSAQYDFDAEINASTWDMSSIITNDDTQWAALLGNDGIEIRYEAADVLTGVYSAWMTLTTFRGEADPTGRYLSIQIRINCADGINYFYPMAWIGIDFTAGLGGGPAPTLNAVVNDLTGTSATLTLTPPIGAGYVQTEVYYRRMSGPNGVPISTWASGGNYVGVGGVPGIKQVIGLEQDQLYEFILYASYGAAGASPPSIAMRIVTTDDGDSVVERILRDMAAWIESIAVVDGYNFDVKDVRIIRSPAQAQLEEYPGVVLYIDSDRYNDERPTTALGSITHHVVINVEGWVTAYEEDERLDDLEAWVADLERAILEGRRRSGQARTTSIKASARRMAQGSGPYGGVVFEVEVYYVTDFGNPYQRR